MNSDVPTNCSRDWIRRVSAGEDRERASAAAFTVPSRATATNACIESTGGSLRTASTPHIVQCSKCTARICEGKKKGAFQRREVGRLLNSVLLGEVPLNGPLL